ncbi:MAG: FtsQ-type POTRA domain-containing protein [Lachnospiraceae bacterium]|nr:FtsQ-type POTRA domain-containing protein [Lachnospiraceae bacterium]
MAFKKKADKLENEYSAKESSGGKYKKSPAKKLLFLIVIVLAVFAVLLSPIFNIKQINITEMKKYSKEEICSMIGVAAGGNLFAYSSQKAKKILTANTYVESVQIKKSFPNTINIEINERKVRGYVPYMDSYLYIDEYGRVLEIKGSFTDPLPVVTGLKFSSFQLGEKIEAENKDAFDEVVVIAQVMTKYEMLDTVVKLDVSNTEKITAYVNKIEINLGNITNCDEKIRTMAAVVKQIPEKDRGSLDLSDLSKPIVFKYLT